MKIKNIKAKRIFDSRGNSTVEVELETNTGIFSSSCPAGASVGKNEALTVDVSQAIKNINKIIAPAIKGRNPENQKEIDDLMIRLDGTENKSKLGANAILPASMAVCRAGAAVKKIGLYQHIADLSQNKNKLFIPLPMFNILNGGKHASNDLAIQEFMIVPHEKTIAENLVKCNNIFNKLKNEIEKEFGKNHLVLGDEGGFAPPISFTKKALFLLRAACDREGIINFALDSAASQFYKNGKYLLENNEINRSQLLEFYMDLANEFPIISFEDPFAEDDWQGWEMLSSKFKIQNPKLLIIGDDLTTTNIKKIKEAHNKNACNGIILKLNQAGTVSETIEASNLAKSFGWKTIVSHRSGETMDDLIADLAVGLGAEFIKAGSPAKPERMVKYNRLLKIEQELKHG